MPVCETARGYEGGLEALPRPGQEDEIRNVTLAHVPGAFEAVNGEEVDAEVYGALRVPDRGAFVQDGAAGGFQLLYDGAGGVASCFDDGDAGVYDGLGVAVVVGWDEGGEQGQIYAEGAVGHGFAALDLGEEVGGGGLR